MGNILSCAGNKETCSAKEHRNANNLNQEVVRDSFQIYNRTLQNAPDQELQNDNVDEDVTQSTDKSTNGSRKSSASFATSENNGDEVTANEETSSATPLDETNSQQEQEQEVEGSGVTTDVSVVSAIPSGKEDEVVPTDEEENIEKERIPSSVETMCIREFIRLRGFSIALPSETNVNYEMYAVLSLVDKNQSNTKTHGQNFLDLQSPSCFKQHVLQWDCNILLPFHENLDVVVSLHRRKPLRLWDAVLGQHRISINELAQETSYEVKLDLPLEKIITNTIKHQPSLKLLPSEETPTLKLTVDKLSSTDGICGFMMVRAMSPSKKLFERMGRWNLCWVALNDEKLMLSNLTKAYESPILDMSEIQHVSIYSSENDEENQGKKVCFCVSMGDMRVEFASILPPTGQLLEFSPNCTHWLEKVQEVASTSKIPVSFDDRTIHVLQSRLSL